MSQATSVMPFFFLVHSRVLLRRHPKQREAVKTMQTPSIQRVEQFIFSIHSNGRGSVHNGPVHCKHFHCGVWTQNGSVYSSVPSGLFPGDKRIETTKGTRMEYVCYPDMYPLPSLSSCDKKLKDMGSRDISFVPVLPHKLMTRQLCLQDKCSRFFSCVATRVNFWQGGTNLCSSPLRKPWANLKRTKIERPVGGTFLARSEWCDAVWRSCGETRRWWECSASGEWDNGDNGVVPKEAPRAYLSRTYLGRRRSCRGSHLDLCAGSISPPCWLTYSTCSFLRSAGTESGRPPALSYSCEEENQINCERYSVGHIYKNMICKANSKNRNFLRSENDK